MHRQNISFGYPGRIPRGQDHIDTAPGARHHDNYSIFKTTSQGVVLAFIELLEKKHIVRAGSRETSNREVPFAFEYQYFDGFIVALKILPYVKGQRTRIIVHLHIQQYPILTLSY